jgi:hypothetical protein
VHANQLDRAALAASQPCRIRPGDAHAAYLTRMKDLVLAVSTAFGCRAHPLFDGLASRAVERNIDPAGYLLRPIFACRDQAIAAGDVAALRRGRVAVQELLAGLQAEFDAGIPFPIAQQLLDLPVSIDAAMVEETRLEAEEDVAQFEVARHPGDRAALARAEPILARALAASQRLLAAVRYNARQIAARR